jgi:hypothetical protein
MPLESVKHTRTRIIDIDGTVVAKRAPEEYFTTPTEVLPNAVELVNEWYAQGDYIIFWTARPKELRAGTMDMLDRFGFKYHELICGKPYCHESHIYDDNPIFFHQVERDIGIGLMEDEELTAEKQLFRAQAEEIRRLRGLLERTRRGETNARPRIRNLV